MRHHGHAVYFGKGFGFIQPEGGGSTRMFFHVSDVFGAEPAKGDPVTYTLGENRHGRAKAVEVTLEG